jgi:hypothetical protein
VPAAFADPRHRHARGGCRPNPLRANVDLTPFISPIYQAAFSSSFGVPFFQGSGTS